MKQLQGALLSILLISLRSFALDIAPNISVPDEKIREVAHSVEWYKLMHYRPNMWGLLRSEVDGPGFFFSPNGYDKPEEELRAFLIDVYSDKKVGKLKLPIPCSFPERTRFVKEKFNLSIETPTCEVFERFMEQFHGPQSVSIVFSSAYPNNPASMFGHTFLKINSSRNTDLLDVGLNFAAVVADDENGMAFVWLGTTGGYIGQWSTKPYYVKVREYSNFESRDLWEYKLSLTSEETIRLIHHIWELEVNSYFDYFFFDENCSYQILAAIEAIRPHWDLLKHTIYLIPGESVKYVTIVDGAVQEVKFRPSLFNRIHSRYQALSPDEIKIFHSVVSKELEPEQVVSRIAAEAIITYYDYIQNDRPEFFKENYGDDLEKMRARRAELGLLTEEEKQRVPIIEGTTRPEMGHDSYSFSTTLGHYSTTGSRNDSGFLGLRIKSAYHDLLNNDQGYTPYAHIDFPYFEVRYFQNQHRWLIEEIGGIGTTSITPVTDLKTPISFRGLINYRRFEQENDFDLYQVHGEIGGGLSFYFLNESNRFYFLGLAATDVSPDLFRGFSILPGLELGILLNPIHNYKVQLLTRTFCDLMYSNKCYGQNEYQLNQSFSISRNQEIRNINKLKDNAEKRGTTSFESSVSYTWFFN